MNILNTTNAKAGPHNAYNAYKEFADKETAAYVVASLMEFWGMKEIGGILRLYFVHAGGTRVKKF